MSFEERRAILENMEMVDAVFSVDDDDNTVTQGLVHVRDFYGNENQYVFCNGGDRGKDNIPEMLVEGYKFIFGIGGDYKANSSSWILKEWKYPKETRVWGEFSNLFQDDAVKVKELIIQPGQGISLQRHFKRNEIWFVSKGSCFVKHGTGSDPYITDTYELSTSQVFIVKQEAWHQIYNTSADPCHIIEIQYGSETSEEDIERIEYYNREKSCPL